jgi:large subunit ribosomal protein L21
MIPKGLANTDPLSWTFFDLPAPSLYPYALSVCLDLSTMYAVIKTGGKEYRVASGDKVRVETVAASVGSEISFSDVLLVADGDSVKIGRPLLQGAAVKATVLAHGRGDKVQIFKMRRRKHYQKHQGHRQNYTEVRIDSIAA